MSVPFLDTNVILRYITGDDPDMQEDAARLFQRVADGELDLHVPFAVVDEAAAVLSSPRIYGHSNREAAELLRVLLRTRGLLVQDRALVFEALDISAAQNVDFVDAFIVAMMRRDGADTLYSYDRHFNRFPDIQRVEP